MQRTATCVVALLLLGCVSSRAAAYDTEGRERSDPGQPAGIDYVTGAGAGDYGLSLASESASALSVFVDTFDDNAQGSAWTYQGDPSLCWLDEINARLEVRSTSSANDGAAYASDGWKLETTTDFSLSVQFHYGRVTNEEGWVFLSLSPHLTSWDDQHVDFAAGCDSSSPFFHYEALDVGHMDQQDTAARAQSNGTLYLSYDASLDELYVSYTGYGSGNAWHTVSGLLQGLWGGDPLNIAVGGGAVGLAFGSGDAYLDNFVIETGTLSGSTGTTPVYRFWKPADGTHFYTVKESEKDKLINSYSHIYTYEGPVYYAYAEGQQPAEARPVYRFWKAADGTHFYTMKDSEADKLINDYSHIYTFEGPVFYAYAEGEQPVGTQAVHRFWKPQGNTHFYTIKASERDKLINSYSHIYTHEGAVWYAYE